jgi:hypothetical protein
MIQISSAFAVENTGFIELEARLVSLDADRNRLISNCLN